MISMIFAWDKNHLIGKNNSLPWHAPEDLKFFKETTVNHTVVMGRKTFDGIVQHSGKPLPKRKNVVCTRHEMDYPGVKVVHNLVEYLKQPFEEEIFIIGGKSIYETALSYANRIYITEIPGEYEGDTYLNLDLSAFEKVSETKKFDLVFSVYERHD